MRIACARVPLFPLAARLRCEPDLLGEALAIFDGNGNTARVIAATRTARRAGITPGLTLTQARALLPKLIARGRDPEGEWAAHETLCEVAETFSPRIEEGEAGTVYLDIFGIERHFPATDLNASELELGRAMTQAAEANGLPVWVGIASSKLAARIASSRPESPVSIAAGEEASFLAPLSILELAPELRLATTLERWGVRCIGDLARLPAAQIASRLGSRGSELHDMAQGRDPAPLVPRVIPPTFREGMDLEWPLVALEPFLFAARPTLERLGQRLRHRGFACAELALSLHLEPDGHDERRIHLPAPTTDLVALCSLLRLDLERQPPGAPVRGFVFIAHPDQPRSAQLSLLGPDAPSPERLATVLARLFALLGPERVGSPAVLDSHRPEGFRLERFDPPPPPKIRRPPREGRGLLVVRILRPPIPLEVITGPPPANHSGCAETATFDAAAVTDSRQNQDAEALTRPRSVRALISADGPAPPRLDGAIRLASGPWHLEEAWWSGEAIDRDYWDVELTDGRMLRIYRDRHQDEWFADGVYD